MRLHVLGDLHLEFGPVDIPLTEVDVGVLAGDIDVGTQGLAWIRSRFLGRPVLYVLGNHEFYGHNLTTLTESLRRKAAGSRIHLLENSSGTHKRMAPEGDREHQLQLQQRTSRLQVLLGKRGGAKWLRTSNPHLDGDPPEAWRPGGQAIADLFDDMLTGGPPDIRPEAMTCEKLLTRESNERMSKAKADPKRSRKRARPTPLAQIKTTPAGTPVTRASLVARRVDLLKKLHAWLDKRCTVTLRKNVLYVGLRGRIPPGELRIKGYCG